MKRFLALFLLFSVKVFGQQNPLPAYPCGLLPPEFWCNTTAWIDTLDLAVDSNFIELDSSLGCNLWQIGHNNKPEFGVPGVDFGLITDTVNPYSGSSKCSFILKLPFAEYQWPYVFVMFEHRFKADSLRDGGYIEYSCDNQHWMKIVNNGSVSQPQIQLINFPGNTSFWPNLPYPVIQDSIYAFTGSNSDWQWSGFGIGYFDIVTKTEGIQWGSFCSEFPPDSIYFKFTFDSDTINDSLSGWMIRSLVWGSSDLPTYLTEKLARKGVSVFPNPSNGEFELQLPDAKDAVATVYDIFGKTILVKKVAANCKLDFSVQGAGIYYTQIRVDDVLHYLKLVVE
jgi:hypothetical protein